MRNIFWVFNLLEYLWFVFEYSRSNSASVWSDFLLLIFLSILFMNTISFNRFRLFSSVQRANLRSVPRFHLFKYFMTHLVGSSNLLLPPSLCPWRSWSNLQLTDLICEIAGRSFDTLLSGQHVEILRLLLLRQKTIWRVLFLTLRLLIESVCIVSTGLGEGS